MSSISRTRNPLIHSGTSQYERLLQTLTPSYFKIDDRSIKDLLHATYQYAECLHYYDENNQKQGHWQCFWKVEMLTFLAHLSTIDVGAILQGYETIKENHRQLDVSDLEAEERQVKNNEYLLALIEYLRDLALRVEEMVLYLPDELPLKQEIIALIEKDTLTDTEQLASELGRLIQFHKEAYKQVYDTRLPASEYEALFKPHWGIPDRVFFDIELDADSSYQNNEQEDLDQLLKKFEQTFRKIKLRANYWFDLNIDTPQLREPHVALFLAFLRLFDHARNSLNQLTRKHLEFYYEKILCLDTRPAVPDDAHLILELAATVDQHLIEKGTQFIAGKDQNGKPLLFQTLENWFLNKAQVKSIKTTYLDICGVFRGEDGVQTKKIYATEDVKTAYRKGEEQPNESKDCWRSMGDDADLPDGKIGFAIASPQLILREGRREITITIKLSKSIGLNLPDQTLVPENFSLYLSSEEDWIKPQPEPNPNNFGFQLSSQASDTELVFRIYLEEDTPPIVRLSEELIETTRLTTRWPIFKCFLNKDYQAADDTTISYLELYEKLRCINITRIIVNVDVEGIRENLITQSDLGVFDGTQKFYPFGPTPEIGDHFYIGSTEVFQKALDTLVVCFDWIAPPDDFVNHYNGYYENIGVTGNPGSEQKQVSNPLYRTPFMKVDFIDRARINPPTAVLRSKPFDGNTSVEGIVTDFNGELLSGVMVFVDSNDPSGISDDTTDIDGKFEISNINTASTLSFFYIFRDSETAPYKELVARERIRLGGFEQQNNIPLDGFSSVNIVLFRPIQDRAPYFFGSEPIFQKYIFNVKDIFGGLISSLGFQDSGGTSIVSIPSPTGTVYEFSAADYLTIKSNLFRIVSPNYVESEVELEEYSAFNVVLYPNAIRVASTANQGTVFDKTQNELIEVKISAVDSNGVKITIIKSNSGTYDLPLANFTGFTAENIEYTHPNHETFITPLSEISDFSTLDIILHLPKKVNKFKGVNGIVRDINGRAINGVAVNIVDGSRTGTISTAGGSYSLPASSEFLFEDDSLNYSLADSSSISFYPSRVHLFGDTVINAVLYKKYEVRNDASVQIEVLVKDVFGNALSSANFQPVPPTGAIVGDSTNGQYTLIDTSYISTLRGSTDFRISQAGFLDVIIPDSNLTPSTDQIEVFLQPDPITASNIDTSRVGVSGIITNGMDGSLIAGAQIIARWTNGSVNYISSTTTDDSGTYKFPFLPSDEVEFECSHPDFISVVINESAPNIIYDQLSVNLFSNNNTLFNRNRGFAGVVEGNLFELFSTNSSRTRSIEGKTIITHVPSTSGSTQEIIIENGSDYRVAGVSSNDLLYFFYQNTQGDQFLVQAAVDGYRTIDIVFHPDRFQKVTKGIVRDAFNENLVNNVNIELFSGTVPTYRKVQSDLSGNYAIHIPQGLVTPRLEFKQVGFLPIEITIETSVRTVNPSNGARSLVNVYSYIDVYLNIQQLNRLPLIDNERGGASINECFPININALNLVRDTRTQEFTRYSPTLERGFIQLTLDGADFLHDEYQEVLVICSILAAKYDIFEIPNPPYTPATNSITLNYTSEQEIYPVPTNELGGQKVDEYFHLIPFGFKEIKWENTEPKLIYPYNPHDINFDDTTYQCDECPANGNLYIGLENLTPGSILSLLIQIKEGSEQNPDVEVPEVCWSYLAKDNEWKPLSQSKILKDTTNGLKKTGIFQLTTPKEMSSETTLFEGNCHWLRAAVVEKADKSTGESESHDDCNPPENESIATQLAIGLPSIIDIQSQAVQVQFLDQENELSHLAQPLSDSTIQQLLISQSQVKAIEQPFPSFNGRLAEAGDAFYVRVSERLHHRDRVVTIYDYERLLLERFPKIQRAKCLNHTKPGSLNILKNPDVQLIDTELAPGYVTVAVIPKFSGRTGEAATEPRFSRGDLVEMERYLRSKTNLFVASKDRLGADYLRVVNPIYEEVRLCFAVQFKTGEAPESRRFDLDRALKGFLSPWLFDNKFDIPFEQSLNRSNIIHFIKNQNYVDAIADFKMIHCGFEVSGNEIIPTTSRSILTSIINEDDNPNTTDHTIHSVDDICDENELKKLNCEN